MWRRLCEGLYEALTTLGGNGLSGAERISFQVLRGAQHGQQRPEHDAKIRYIKNDSANASAFYIEGKIVHYILSLQPVIGIAEGAAQQKGKPDAQQIVPPGAEAEEESGGHEDTQNHGQRRHDRASVLSQVQHGAFVVIFFDQDTIVPQRFRQTAGRLGCGFRGSRIFFAVMFAVLFDKVLDFQISEENSCNYHTGYHYHLIPPETKYRFPVKISIDGISPCNNEASCLFRAGGIKTFSRPVYYSHDRERATVTRSIYYSHDRERTTF